MKNLIIAIIVILIIIGIVYYVNKDSGDVIEDVNDTEMVDKTAPEGNFTTDDNTPAENGSTGSTQ